MMELSQKGERRRAELAALTFALALMCSQILAADFQVTNTLDSGEGSLRWAISSANSTLGANTIICTNVSGVIALSRSLFSIQYN